jgi:hypothetical protein
MNWFFLFLLKFSVGAAPPILVILRRGVGVDKAAFGLGRYAWARDKRS